MFWRFGGYANVSAIDSILEKSEFTTEELLDESDLIQELKQHNTKLLEYIRKREVLEKLLDYAVAPKLEAVAVPDKKEDDDKGKAPAFSFARPRASSRANEPGSEEEEAEKRRNKYAFVASEILSSDNWSVIEALMDVQNRDLLHNFWRFLQRPSPLDPLQASYFTKVNETLFDKKTEEMIGFLKAVNGAVPNMLRHVDSPMVMDLLLKIITLERTDGGHGIVEWLFTQDVMPSLLSFLGPENSWATQTSAGDFMKAIITVSANASQNEQTCIGPNELTRQLVSKSCVEQLIGYMLGGGNALTVGVGIVIEVIRKNNSDYDPDVGAEANSVPSSRDPIYLGTLLRMFAENVPKFMNLIMIGEEKPHFESTFGERIQSLGFDRFKTCELMAELLHCSNMGLLNEVGSEALIAARDAERHRLRAQGSLTAVRGEEAPANGDDLTMRLGSSPPERRLEITNISDDDGFEEVMNAAEMPEDTSHEFVKAEEEIPQSLPASSFLDKDEDDFVDEPLSSPRLNVSDSKMEEHQFEEPDMVVQPLSPRKLATAELAKNEASDPSESNPSSSKVTTTIKEIEGMVLSGESGDAHSEGSDVQMIDASSLLPINTPTSSVSEVAPDSPNQTAAGPFDDKATGISGTLEPQPEDTPAPLFSSPLAISTADATAQVSITPSNEDKPADVKSEDQSRGITATTSAQESGEESIIVGHEVEQTAAENDQLKPVVGDFLKMQFVDYKVVPTILSFFFKYPWNNFLHNVVYDVVQQVFNGPMNRGFNPTLAISLFESADITAQIINGQVTSEKSEANTKTRMGYMGHLTLIAEEVVKFNERHPPELLSETVLEKVMSPEWSNYVEGPLAETRERDNAILGGVRPDVAMSNRAAAQSSGLSAVGISSLSASIQGSSALADAGLNGGLDLQENGGSNQSQFAISAGTMGGLSGFGSSSDEEDDDQDDNDDDVANEFRAYTDPLNSSKSGGPSLNPPSIPPPPPPPPPLNIPPSRARLQLAARLAMNKRNAASADGGQENGTSESSSHPNDGGKVVDDDSPNQGLLHQPLNNISLAERLKDPFADEVEDDEDEDDEESAFASAGDDKSSSRPSSGGWNRGNWWRGVVRGGVGGSSGSKAQKPEKFGDGRDDDDDSDLDDDDEDEEFGDFAMPEVMDAPIRASDGPAGQFFDREREKVLLKPLPVHPPQGSTAAGAGGSGGGGSKFGSLWPFDGLGFGGSAAEGSKDTSGEEKKDQVEGVKSGAGAEGPSAAKASSAQTNGECQAEPVVVNEDGKPVERTVEAKRRTSIEDPDDDDQVVV